MSTFDDGDRPDGSVAIVVAAAGLGTRFGGALPKALELIAGRPLLAYSLATLSELYPTADFVMDAVIVTSPAGFEAEIAAVCAGFSLPLSVVTGGAERSDSIALALQQVPAATEIVLVHDAARAFTPAALFCDVVAAVRSGSAAVVPGVPVADTIRRLEGAHQSQTVDRSELRRVQTPQGFSRAQLDIAYAQLGAQQVTDDASVMELLGIAVDVIPGSEEAFKVTTPIDRATAEAIVKLRSIR